MAPCSRTAHCSSSRSPARAAAHATGTPRLYVVLEVRAERLIESDLNCSSAAASMHTDGRMGCPCSVSHSITPMREDRRRLAPKALREEVLHDIDPGDPRQPPRTRP